MDIITFTQRDWKALREAVLDFQERVLNNRPWTQKGPFHSFGHIRDIFSTWISVVLTHFWMYPFFGNPFLAVELKLVFKQHSKNLNTAIGFDHENESLIPRERFDPTSGT